MDGRLPADAVFDADSGGDIDVGRHLLGTVDAVESGHAAYRVTPHDVGACATCGRDRSAQVPVWQGWILRDVKIIFSLRQFLFFCQIS